MTDADQAHRDWLWAQLQRAAEDFGATVVGEPRWSWRDRTVGAHSTTADGADAWLRVVSEDPYWAHGEFWTGNADAEAIQAVPKPHVLARRDWSDEGREIRVELMDYITSPAISDQIPLRQPVDLDPSWWSTLRRSLDALAMHPTNRIYLTGASTQRQALAYFGIEFELDVVDRTTAHCDLHWANLTAPDLNLLDWESWGTAPAGYDAAMLYCTSILQPDIAAKVHDTFADILDTPTGVAAQLAAAARLLGMVSDGDHTDLAIPLHQHARKIARRIS